MPRRGRDDDAWDQEERARRTRTGESWYRQPDSAPLLSGIFWTLWDKHLQEFKELEERVEQNERRLPEERAKYFLRDMLAAFWGKVFLIIVAIVVGYLASNWWSGVPQPWTR